MASDPISIEMTWKAIVENENAQTWTTLPASFNEIEIIVNDGSRVCTKRLTKQAISVMASNAQVSEVFVDSYLPDSATGLPNWGSVANIHYNRDINAIKIDAFFRYSGSYIAQSTVANATKSIYYR